MKKTIIRAAAAATLAAGLIALAAPASAQSTVDVAWNVGVVSDYVFRGFSQTGEDPAIQGGVDLTSGSFYAGAWASNVDFGDDTDAEVDLYGGYRTEAGGFALDFGVIGYLYVGEPDGADYNYAEFKAAASRAVGPATFGAAVYYSPDFFGIDDEATYAEVNAALSPAPKWTVSGALGKQWLNVTDDYTTWNVGVGYALTDKVGLDVRYHDSDVDGVPGAEDRIVGAVKLTF
ncbi:TorF family putative porin [uncultured Brevundimonas sp.]|uniref:TorF family putative porin n=1 Tax=uncultured Brevundimonas sp. TaxID=213418 RepID=UPI0025F24268|nr:TorF family putative porin [uncultured Brevundimonas sp.]